MLCLCELTEPMRVGIGYDIHALVPERKLILGGVDIPFSKGLEGHSDADVLVHAIIDALLGAAGLGDIGHYFPDTDPQWTGVSSLLLLQTVSVLLIETQWKVGNVDAVIVAQSPKISPYIETIRKNIAAGLQISSTQVNIKATTPEGLGALGRLEGIASFATVLLQKTERMDLL